MHKEYIKASHKRINEQLTNFYTPTGIHVYFKDHLYNDKIDVEKAVSKLESLIPTQLLSEIEMIIIGHFDEFEERDITAFYKDGTLHISNIQDNEDSLLDNMVHETAHAVEVAYGYEIYSDLKIKKEFLVKREHLHNLLWKLGYKAPKKLFLQTEYDYEFDQFLLKDVGYGKLSQVVNGLFISPYSPTSLREYFATGFAEFYLHPNEHTFLKQIGPALYAKLERINNVESLDNS
tara:strand:- start:5023 stop:5724 length:702 start_codon:yes stop_codon:yes gene_type:complete